MKTGLVKSLAPSPSSVVERAETTYNPPPPHTPEVDDKSRTSLFKREFGRGEGSRGDK